MANIGDSDSPIPGSSPGGAVIVFKENIVNKNSWIKYGLSWEDFCWKKDNLAKVGTLVEINNKIYLIGDINELGGVCDDCMDFDKIDIVTRYKKITIEKD